MKYLIFLLLLSGCKVTCDKTLMAINTDSGFQPIGERMECTLEKGDREFK